jgi:hypothetical protein
MQRSAGNGRWLYNDSRRGTASRLRTARRGSGVYDPLEVFSILKQKGKATGVELLTAKRLLSSQLGIDIADFDSTIDI